MNCLPVVSRELRVSARKRSTFWLRVTAAVAGLLIGGGCLLLTAWQSRNTAQMGSNLFHTLIWFTFAAGLCSGLFFTSDCISEEKREGTLGLLFLTSLRGYDVALGKLAATSLRGVYALLAVLPILAITQLMGGVTGAEYWKSALALLNGLFVSLSAGLLISTLCCDSQKALSGTLLLLLLLTFAGPITDGIIADTLKRNFTPLWCLSSPGYVLVLAGAWGRSAYWTAVLVNQAMAWTMLAGACLIVPRAWQERKRAGRSKNRGLLYAWKYGSARRRQRLRRRLLDRHPMLWLICRERWQAKALWVIALAAAAGFLALVLKDHQSEGWMMWNYLSGPFLLILYLWAASQACRFLVDARRSGLLELLLATPLEARQIVAGQWRGMLRRFGLPVLLLLSVYVAGAIVGQLSLIRMAIKTNAQISAAAGNMPTNAPAAATNVVNATATVSVNGTTASFSTKATSGWLRTALKTPSQVRQIAIAAASATIATLRTLGNLLAIIWFGMWMGLTSRSPNLASLKTIVFVQVIPWFVITFGSTVASATAVFHFAGMANTASPGDWMLWWPLLNAAFNTAVVLVKDIGFIAWARKRLHTRLREQAARDLGAPHVAPPPPLPRLTAAPPIIPASA